MKGSIEKVAEPSEEDVIEEEEHEEEEREVGKEEEPTVRQLTETFAITEKLKEAIRNSDSDSDQCKTHIHEVQKGLKEYKHVWNTNEKLTTSLGHKIL